MATLEELVVRIKADATALEREMKRAGVVVNDNARKMQAAARGAGGEFQKLGRDIQQFVATYLSVRLVRGTIDAVDRLNDLSKQTGVTVEALSELGFAAKLSGTNIEALAQGMKLLGRNVAEAAAGGGTAKDALKDLGLNAAALADLPLDRQLEVIADAMTRVGSDADRVSFAMDLMGRSGAELLPVLAGGAAGIRDLREEARAMGVTVDQETAERFAALNDEIDKLTMGSQAFARQLLENVVPALNDLIAGLNELLAMAPNTSEFFNSLGAAWVGLRGMAGLDPALVDEALVVAGEQTRVGQRARAPSGRKVRDVTGGLRRTDRSGENDKKEEAQDLDRLNGTLDEYLRNLETERDLLGLTAKEQEGMRAVMEAQNLAMKDGNLLTEEQIAKVRGLAEANYELKDRMQESARFAQELKDKLSGGLADIALSFDSATDSAKRFAEQLAQTIIERKITGPLADSIIGAIDGTSIGSGISELLGFADGGRPPVGRPSIVGERGPEIFVPNTAGAIVPNHALGGRSVSVTNVFNVSPGVQGTVEAEVRRMAPVIAAQAQAGVFRAIERGGREAALVGKKS